jgi:hypothetical protein
MIKAVFIEGSIACLRWGRGLHDGAALFTGAFFLI